MNIKIQIRAENEETGNYLGTRILSVEDLEYAIVKMLREDEGDESIVIERMEFTVSEVINL